MTSATDSTDAIVCKATPWFILRAVVMFAMFAVFAAWFYLDASTGYRKKNYVYFLHQTFERASNEFSKLNEKGDLTPSGWQEFAIVQQVRFPDDASILPASLQLPMPWPEILHDYEKVKPLQWKSLWESYSGDNELSASPPEQHYPANKIQEQWIVFYICLVLAAGALFFLLRTMSRSIRVNHEGLIAQTGIKVPFQEMKTIDLRKWDSKGLAYIHYEGQNGSGRVRVDGLTYGGFKAEDGEPAEKLMQAVRAKFSGEIIEYEKAAESDDTRPKDT